MSKRTPVETAEIPTLAALSDMCVESDTGCWLKVGVRDGRYGRLVYRGKEVHAHRLAWESVNGPMPRELSACHRCNTPRCMNPAHIYAATHKQNITDAARDGLMGKPGRSPYGPSTINKLKTHCNAGHALSGENLRIESYGSRRCRTCWLAAAKRSENRKKAARDGIKAALLAELKRRGGCE
jgi:hypothetical protein